jgi:putative PIN family toxin of toxin-antitoxin system
VRVVLDTSTLITAIRSRGGAASWALDHILDGKVTLLMNYPISCEYRDVAFRPQHLAKSALSLAQAEVIISSLESVAEHVETLRRYRPLSLDPNDDLILELAINGDADVIVTQNLRHIRNVALRFGIVTVDPHMFMMMSREAGRHGSSE